MRWPFLTDSRILASATARPTYVWKGVDGSGSPRQGEILARNPAHAKAMLRHQGIRPTRVSRRWLQPLTTQTARLRRDATARVLQQLGGLLQAGIPILQALERIQEGLERPEEKALLQYLHQQIEAGHPLSQACNAFPDSFPPLVLELLRAGETSGRLDQVLLRAADHLEQQLALRNKLRSAALYPTIVLIVALAVSLLLLTYVVPQFAELFQGQGLKLPGLTAAVMRASNGLQEYGLLLLLIVGLSALVLWHFRVPLRAALRPRMDPLILRLPAFGGLVQTAQVARFARTLETLLHAGVPILLALERTAQVLTSLPFREAVQQTRTQVEQGRRLAQGLGQSGIFPALTIQFVATGEESGQLTTLLGHLADHYEAGLRQQLDRLTTLAEPLLIILISAIVGVLVIAMYLPIFQMGQAF